MSEEIVLIEQLHGLQLPASFVLTFPSALFGPSPADVEADTDTR